MPKLCRGQARIASRGPQTRNAALVEAHFLASSLPSEIGHLTHSSVGLMAGECFFQARFFLLFVQMRPQPRVLLSSVFSLACGRTARVSPASSVGGRLMAIHTAGMYAICYCCYCACSCCRQVQDKIDRLTVWDRRLYDAGAAAFEKVRRGRPFCWGTVSAREAFLFFAAQVFCTFVCDKCCQSRKPIVNMGVFYNIYLVRSIDCCCVLFWCLRVWQYIGASPVEVRSSAYLFPSPRGLVRNE